MNWFPQGIFAFIFVTVLQMSASMGQTWSQLGDFPGVARDDGASFTIGAVAYCGTGVASTFATQSDFYAFDMSSAEWSAVASLPDWAARQYAVGFSHAGFGYIFGGISGGIFLNDLWRYDPGADTWTQILAMPDVGRSGAMGFVLGDTAYILGGKTTAIAALSDVWAFHIPSETWVEKAPMPFGARWRAAASSRDGFGYLLGGMDEALVFQTGFFQYNPEADTWTSLTSFPGEGRNYMAMESIGGVLTTFAGFDADATFHKDMWIYGDDGGDWTQLNSLPVPGRRGGMHFTDGFSFYYTTGLFADFERSKETWKAADVLTVTAGADLKDFELFPNPADGEISLSLKSAAHCGQVRVSVIDQVGRVCHEVSFQQGSNLEISLHYLPAGVYLMAVETYCGRSFERFVKI